MPVDTRNINLERCYLVHAYGGAVLPEDGYLLPSTFAFSSVADAGEQKTIACGVTCVYFSFNAPVPSSSSNYPRFSAGPLILIPFNTIFNQIISVGFAECIALGPVKIPQGSIIIYPNAIPSRVPTYYHGYELIETSDSNERNTRAKRIIFEKSGISIIMENRGDVFPVFAEVRYPNDQGKQIQEKVAPKKFFAPLLTNNPELAIGTDSCAYQGGKHWLSCMASIDVNQPYARNSVFNFLIMHYSMQKSLRWLRKLPNLPQDSLLYFTTRCALIYRSWLALSPDVTFSDTAKIEPELQSESADVVKIEDILKHYRTKTSDISEEVIFYDIIFKFVVALQGVFGIDIKEFIIKYTSFLKEFLSSINKMARYSEEDLTSLLALIYSLSNDNITFVQELDNGYSLNDEATMQNLISASDIQPEVVYSGINPNTLPYSIRCLLYTLSDGAEVGLKEYFDRFLSPPTRVPRLITGGELKPKKFSTSNLDSTSIDGMIQKDLQINISEVSIKDLADVPSMVGWICHNYPGLSRLFNSSAQVSQRYTVKTHTLMFNEALKNHLSLPAAQSRLLAMKGTCPNIINLFFVAITLHDLGKAIGDKEEQHRHTWSVVNPFLSKWGYTSQEISFIRSLIDHDVIGNFVKEISLGSFKTTDVETDAIKATTMALFANHSSSGNLINCTYHCYLQFLFYLADAGSYPQLYTELMQPVDQPFLNLGFQYLLKPDNYQPFFRLLQHVLEPRQQVPQKTLLNCKPIIDQRLREQWEAEYLAKEPMYGKRPENYTF